MKITEPPPPAEWSRRAPPWIVLPFAILTALTVGALPGAGPNTVVGALPAAGAPATGPEADPSHPKTAPPLPLSRADTDPFRASFWRRHNPDPDTLWVARFSRSPAADHSDSEWRPIAFGGGRGETEYRPSAREGRSCLQAEARGAGSGLIRLMEAEPLDFPRLRWSWWVQGPVPGGDLTRKDGDDAAARVYVNFRFDHSRAGLVDRLRHRLASRRFGGEAPGKSLVYVWANNLPPGTMIPNAYTDKAMIIVVRSGVEDARRWWDEERNILEDFRKAFGEDPPGITSVAIMTDADDTGAQAMACYGDILLIGSVSASVVRLQRG
jgi:hypothetical protein